MLTLVEKVLILAEVPLLARIGTADLAPLAQVARPVDLPAGEIVFSRGDAPDALHVVVSGRVRLEAEGGRLDLGEGGCFGAWALLDAQPRRLKATTLEPTRLLSLDGDAFVEVITDHANVARGLLRELAARLRAAPSDGLARDAEMG